MPAGVAGSYAGLDWLCGWAIARRMAASAGVMAALSDHDIVVPALRDSGAVTAPLMESAVPWPRALDRLVAAGEPAALHLADELATVLGVLVATLVTGPADARAARPDWPAEHWRRWAAVHRVALGGGVMSGLLGARLAEGASSWLLAAGVDVRLVVPPSPQHLGLLGAATLLTGSGVALDCGGSTIKRAAVAVDDERRDPTFTAGSADGGDAAGWVGARRSGRSIARLPDVPAPGRVSAPDVVAVIADAIAAVSSEFEPRRADTRVADDADGILDGPGHPASSGTGAPDDADGIPLPVSLSLATYVDERGQPWQGQLGPYAPLGDIDFVGELAAAGRSRTGRGVAIRVTHDGAAALLGARVTDPAVDAAIVLGTAIGCGLAHS